MLVATAWRHTGYIMLIYLAGLKGVDATLREAAAVDGASEVKTFFHVIFPVMRPINMIVIVIVVIESLRAFDLVWVINKGRNGLEVIGALVAQNVIGEATRYGFGSALAVIMMLISSIFITIYLRNVFREERRAMSTRTLPAAPAHALRRGATRTPPKRAEGGVMSKPRGVVVTVIVALLALVVAVPAAVGVDQLLPRVRLHPGQRLPLLRRLDHRPTTSRRGRRATSGCTCSNSLLVTVPAVLLTLWLSSMVAFVLARFSYRFNLLMLGVFLAANLLPPQALLIPVFRMFREVPLPLFMSDSGSLLNSFWALILVNTAFQMGFCTFVLSNYMKTLPHEIYESAELDGASVWRQYWQLTMPLVRPALAALATLQVTWVYNEFFWATVLIQQGDKLPMTSALNNLRGQFFTDTNLVAAGSIIVALPVLVVFFALQKQFVSGLTLGSTKG